MAKKIVALDVLTGILKQVYNKTKDYIDEQITISLNSLRSLIEINSDNITTLKNTTSTQQETIDGLSRSVATLQSKLGTAESDITTLKNDVSVLQSKVYDYLGNDEIDTVFDET